MNNRPEREENFLLTFSDLIGVVKKNKRRITFCSLAVACLALFYGLTKPIEYQTEATFKEKGKSSSGLGRSLSEFFLIGDTIDSDALTLMKSRKLIEQLVKSLGLQATIVKEERRFPFLPMQTIKNNLLIEYALFKSMSTPVLQEPAYDLKIKHLEYDGEVPLGVRLVILSEDSFLLKDGKGKKLGEAMFGEPFSTKEFSITLIHNHSTPLKDNEYVLLLQPLGSVAKHIGKKFTIETDRNDKSLLKISYKHPDRKETVAHINALMAVYEAHILHEHQRISSLQVDYLVKRQKEMAKQLEEVMSTHAKELSSDLSTTGFATSEKAMDFLAASQEDLKQKLLTIDLEIQRLENLQSASSLNYEKCTSTFHPEIINHLTTEIRSLKQQADALSLAIRSVPLDLENFHESFSSQLKELDEIKECAKEAKIMLEALDKDALPPRFDRLMTHPKFVVKAWYERLETAQNNYKKGQRAQEEWKKNKEGFSSYLSHLIHYLYVHLRNSEERLAQQQPPLAEFQGINLSTARDLYITYSKELSDVESRTIQQRFIIKQVADPNFEISSLSTVLTDPISAEMISRASNIILALKDQDNRSPKEQERLKADLAIQKKFLTTHLEQTVVILELRQKFLKEKIQSLQSINLSLIQEQISILENQLKDYISSALENLNQEQTLLEKNLVELRLEMAAFPQKWATEQLIQQQMKINLSMVEEITKLVESKNISNNLEKIQSAPLDLPIAPIHPKSPQLLFLAIIGAIAGAFIGFAWSLAGSVARGVEASAETLRLNGQHVSGKFSRSYQESSEKDPLLDSDLDTLRRLIAYMAQTQEPRQKTGDSLLLLKSCGPNYATILAELMAKMNLKVVLLDLNFDDPKDKPSSGLLQYLEGNSADLPITPKNGFDFISPGGACRYANELLGSHQFKELLKQLRSQYDWVLAVNSSSPISAEAESLIELFSNAAISITEESLTSLRHLLNISHKPGTKLSFIMTNRMG